METSKTVSDEPPAEPRKSLRPAVRWAIWVLGPLSVLGMVMWAVHSVSNRRLQDTLDELRRDGVLTTLEELAPPPIPDEENAATIYHAAISLLPSFSDRDPIHRVRQKAIDQDYFSLQADEKQRIRGYLAG